MTRFFSLPADGLTYRRVAQVGALFPFEFSLNLKVLSNLFLSSYKELRILYQFLVLQLSKLNRLQEKTKGTSSLVPKRTATRRQVEMFHSVRESNLVPREMEILPALGQLVSSPQLIRCLIWCAISFLPTQFMPLLPNSVLGVLLPPLDLTVLESTEPV